MTVRKQDLPKATRIHQWWRCAGCGAQLRRNEDCQEHPRALRIRWGEPMASAYRVQLERAERGEEPEKHEGLLGNTYVLAARFVARWAGVGARSGVPGARGGKQATAEPKVYEIPSSAPRRKCCECGVPLAMVFNPELRKTVPVVVAAGTSHFLCPNPKRFSRKAGAR